MQTYMTIFGQEGLGRPGPEAQAQVRAMEKHLDERLAGNPRPSVQAALVFTNERAEIDAKGAPLPAIHLRKLKDFMRQQTKANPLRNTMLQTVRASLPNA